MPVADVERPTIAEVKQWPPTVEVERAALAIGVARSALYEAIRLGYSPVETVKVGRTLKVLTRSIVRLLEGSEYRRETA